MKKYRLRNQIIVSCLAAVLSLEMPLSVYAAPKAVKTVSENDTKEAVLLPIDEERFPDSIFRNHIQEMFDTDGDGCLSEEEINSVLALDVSGMNIRTLEGIGYFACLESLDCSYNRLSRLGLDGLDYCEIRADHNAYLSANDDKEEFETEDREVYTEKTLIESAKTTTVELYTEETFTDTEIDEETFPDEAFVEYIRTYLDTDQDGILSADEAAEVTVINISGWGIGNLKGISIFKNLVYLNYADNPVTGPDLSENIYLLEAVSEEEEEADFEEVGEEPEVALQESAEEENTELAATEFEKPAILDVVSVSGNDDVILWEINDEKAAVSSNTVPAASVPFTIGTPKLSNVKNPAKGKVSVSFSSCTNAKGYEVQYCRKGNFASGVVVTDVKNTSVTITNLPKNKTYYFRVRAYGINKKGKTVYSPYSNILSVKIKNGVAEQKYSSKAGKVKSCKIVKNNTFSFKASVKKRVAGSDDCYYLCQVDPYTDKRVRTIAAVGKTTTVSVSLPVIDDNGRNLIEGKYALFIKNKGKFKIITNAVYLSNPERAATYTAAFPKSDSKKGLQGAVGKTDLGVSHTLINIPLTDVIAKKGEGVPYVYNGKTYYFKPSPYTGVIRYCNEQKVTVSAVFLLPWDENLKNLITPLGRRPYAANYYAWNTSNQAARENLEAAFMYLAEKYSRENCHLDNWILGNEVNIRRMWNYAGNMSYKNYIKNYAQSFQLMYYAAVSHNKNARVYISLDHTWLNRDGDCGAKNFMTDFNGEIKAIQKNIRWNLAYHAYPVPLTEPAFWGNYWASNNINSSFVTLKNLNILTDYVKKNFGKKTRIILSEQGFTSTAGEHIQAAAIAYGYYIAEFNDMVDSFIIRSDFDNATETAQGLKMGLRDINGNPKQAYNVFKYMDTPRYKTYTAGCLKTLNKASWKDLVKNFKESRLKAMPDR